MDLNVILQNFKKHPNKLTYNACLNYCYNNTVDFDNHDSHELFVIVVSSLMKNKVGKFTEDDAKVIIKYFSNKMLHIYGIKRSTSIDVLSEEEYNEKIGGTSDAICCHKDEKNTIYYSPAVIKQLASNNTKDFLRGMRSIFHETTHSIQNNVILSSGLLLEMTKPILPMYTMTVEDIVRMADPEFYKKNYSNLYSENHAEMIGLQMAMEEIKSFNPSLYDKYNEDYLNSLIDKYKESITSKLVVFGREGNHLAIMDGAAAPFIGKHPQALNDFPLLRLAYKEDGLKKNITELLEDRRKRIDDYDNINDLNDLYNAICNEKNYVVGGLGGRKEEIQLLVNYLSENGCDDFELNLLKNRLKDTDLSETQVEKIVNYVVNCNAEKHDNDEYVSEKHSNKAL